MLVVEVSELVFCGTIEEPMLILGSSTTLPVIEPTRFGIVFWKVFIG